MSAILDTIIARGFNLNQPEFGRNMIEAQNRRQVIDNGLQNDEIYRQAQQFELNQAQQAVADRQAVGAMLPQLMNLPQEAVQGAEQRLANFDAAAAQGKVDSALRPKAMEMLQGGLETIPARQQQIFAKMAEKDPAIRELLLAAYMKPMEPGFRPATDEDLAQYPGIDRTKAYQVDESTGKLLTIGGSGQTINVGGPPSYQLTEITDANGNPVVAAVNKNDPTDVQTVGDVPAAPVSSKERETAKNKLQAIRAAEQRLAVVKDAWAKIKGTAAAGPFGQGMIPTEAGNNFDTAVAGMSQGMTALTRTPGVGSQSDYEAKLNQAQLPDRKQYESSVETQIASLETLLSDMRNAYSGLTQESQPQGNGKTSKKIKIDANGNIIP